VYDYDKRSATAGAEQTIIFEDVAAGDEFGIMVDGWAGDGEFDVSVEEIGR
jgi:hypothetical protein